MVMKMGDDGIVEEGEEVAVLFLAGSDGCPHAFVITLASFTACSLRDLSVDHTVAEK